MGTAAWDCLENLSTAGEVEAVLLSAPPVLPATAESVLALAVAGTSARLGPGRLTHRPGGVPARRLEAQIFGRLAPLAAGPAVIQGAALVWRGHVVAVRDLPPVELSRQTPDLIVNLDWSVVAYGRDAE